MKTEKRTFCYNETSIFSHFCTRKKNIVIYPIKFEDKISFTAIRSLLINGCISPLGQEKVEQMTFQTAPETIKELLFLVHEYVFLIKEGMTIPVDNIFDVREALQKIDVIGTWIEASEAFKLKQNLETVRKLVKFFHHLEKDDVISLVEFSKNIPTHSDLISKIDRIFDQYGEIKDSASSELKHIRSEMHKIQSSISKRMDSVINAAQKAGLIEKDTTPTIRDGRLVIPVPSGNKRQLNGIIHDESATGKTSFIEPAEVVEANNRLREYKSEERREIIRILTELTDHIRPIRPEISEGINYLGDIDFIRSKARFSISTNCIMPRMAKTPGISWKEAVHPLLYLHLKQEQKEVVPLSIELKNENRILLISGPNAGGKSVCLKTVGIVQYMLQCGLLVPVSKGSVFGVFKKIFIDIGDEQSIDNDLSTYSSHLMNMKYFIRHCATDSLVLIDEFGTGTEPQIGGAIAEAVLNNINKLGTFGVITTHYSNLKHFGNATPGIVNGAMLYDQHKMQPLFQLQIGKPGSSFAIEIARKIGLPEVVISEASEKVGQDHIDMDKHLREIARDRRYWEEKRSNIRRQEKRLEEVSTNVETELSQLNKQRKQIIEEAKKEAEKLLKEANAKIENTIKEIREAKAEKDKTHELRKNLEKFRKEIDKNEDQKTLKSKTREHLPKNIKPSKAEKETALDNKPLAVGDKVKMTNHNGYGEIIELKGKKAIVAFGQLRTTIEVAKIEKISNNQFKRETKSTTSSNIYSEPFRQLKNSFKPEIDLRGQRADEALETIIQFIDQAIMTGYTKLRILHGTGTGALKQITRDYLKTVSVVSEVKDEHVQLGGAGITVVDLDFD